jgi:DnaJ-domain-containing protein 1
MRETTDLFTVLDEPRRPWLDPDALKNKFLTLSATVHPDRVHNLGEQERAAAQERYTRLNAAYNCLREPKERLRHLLELERGALPKDVQQIPGDLMDLSLEIGQACRQTDAFLADRSKATSPLLKVQFFERGQEQTERLLPLQRRLQDRREQLLQDLRRLDGEWAASPDPAARAALLGPLEELYRLLSYFARWNDQVQERITRISF